MTRLACALCALYLAVFVWLAWWTATTYSAAPAWFTAGNVVACLALVFAFAQQLDLIDTRRENAAHQQREDERAADIEHEAATALNDACCERWWTTFGTDHDPTCQHQTPRSSAA